MHRSDELESPTGTLARSAAGNASKAGGYMESRKLCAYNQTRECFLGLEVDGADLSLAKLKDRIATLALKSGEGLWLTPFRGLPEWGIRVPLDLLYLDDDSRVIDVVESYPVFRANAATAAGNGAGPAHPLHLFVADTGGRSARAVRCRRDAAAPRALDRNRPHRQYGLACTGPFRPHSDRVGHQAPRGRCRCCPPNRCRMRKNAPRRALCRAPFAQGETAVERRSGAARIGEPLGG